MSARNKVISPRRMFVILSIVTLILLVGSAILQRTIFHAAQANTAIYLSPAQSTIAPLTNQSLQVHTNISGSSYVASVEISLKYSDIIKVTDTQAAVGWQSEKVTNDNGLIQWVLVPSTDIGPLAQINGDTTIGTIDYQATKTGSSSFIFDGSTQIMVVDSSQNPSLYNAASSLQSAFVLASASGTSTNTGTSTLPTSSIKPIDYQASQVLSVNALAGATDAEITTTANTSVMATVDFGTDQNNLASQIKTNLASVNPAVTLLGLTPNTRYYYKVTTTDTVKSSQQVSSIYSFVTKSMAVAGTVAAKAEIQTLPTLAKDTSTIYFVPIEDTGKVISGSSPTVLVSSGQATVSDVQKQGDIYFATITPVVKTAQTIGINIAVAGQTIGATKISFDPNRVSTTTATSTPTNNSGSILASPLVLAVIFIGLIVLLLILSSAYVLVTKKR